MDERQAPLKKKKYKIKYPKVSISRVNIRHWTARPQILNMLTLNVYEEHMLWIKEHTD